MKSEGRIIVAFFCLLGIFALVGPALAQVEKAPSKFMFDASKPISLAADRLDVDNKIKVARFIGNVVAVQDDVRLNADMVSVFYEREESDRSADPGAGLSALTGGGGEIRSLVASGHVIMIQENRRATCEQIVFDQEKGTVTLTGKPRFFSGTDVLEGEKIVIFVQEERVEVIGAPNRRVRAMVVPKNLQNELPQKAKTRLEEISKLPSSPGDTGASGANAEEKPQKENKAPGAGGETPDND